MTDELGAITVFLDLARPGREGVLRGKTFCVKENIDVEGLVTQSGNPTWASTHEPAPVHAPVVDRLLDSGARLTGKTHMDELAFSLLGANHHFGTPTNPAAPDRHPGGSSSGSAVAVAAGLVDFALGTDTAGSCRAPAAFCGVLGFRPSHGAVPSTGVVPLARTLDTIGWFAREIETLAAVGGVLLPDDLWREPFESAIRLSETFAGCDEAFGPAATPLLEALARDLPVREVDLGEEFWSSALAHFRNLQSREVWQAHGAWIRQANPDFGPGVRERFELASRVTSEDKARADAFRREARAALDELVRPSALLVVPTAPFPSPRLAEDAGELDRKRQRMLRTFLLASLVGLPQISLPLARPRGAPPLALSLIGPRWSDRRLLETARNLVTSTTNHGGAGE